MVKAVGVEVGTGVGEEVGVEVGEAAAAASGTRVGVAPASAAGAGVGDDVRIEVGEGVAAEFVMREGDRIPREIAFAVPVAPLEVLRITHFLLHNDQLYPSLLGQFEKLVAKPKKHKAPAAKSGARRQGKRRSS